MVFNLLFSPYIYSVFKQYLRKLASFIILMVTVKMFEAFSLAMAHSLILLWTCFFLAPYVYADPSGMYFRATILL